VEGHRDLETIRFRHEQVGDHEDRGGLSTRAEPLLAIARLEHVVSGFFQDLAKKVSDDLVIIDDENEVCEWFSSLSSSYLMSYAPLITLFPQGQLLSCVRASPRRMGYGPCPGSYARNRPP